MTKTCQSNRIQRPLDLIPGLAKPDDEQANNGSDHHHVCHSAEHRRPRCLAETGHGDPLQHDRDEPKAARKAVRGAERLCRSSELGGEKE